MYNRDLETNKEYLAQYVSSQKKLAAERLAKVNKLKRLKKKNKE